jgi:hypothetical protein
VNSKNFRAPCAALPNRLNPLDKGQNPENQLRELRGRSWIVRPATAGRWPSRKEFDVVLFWSLDRFSREGVLATLQHLKTLSAHGVEWLSFREEYLRSIGPFKDAVLGILAAIGEQERMRLSERVWPV